MQPHSYLHSAFCTLLLLFSLWVPLQERAVCTYFCSSLRGPPWLLSSHVAMGLYLFFPTPVVHLLPCFASGWLFFAHALFVLGAVFQRTSWSRKENKILCFCHKARQKHFKLLLSYYAHFFIYYNPVAAMLYMLTATVPRILPMLFNKSQNYTSTKSTTNTIWGLELFAAFLKISKSKA